MRQVDLENAFGNGRLKWSLYAEFPTQMFLEASPQRKAMKQKRSLHGLRDATRVWNRFLLEKVTDLMLEELQTEHGILVKEGLLILGYVDDLIMFPRKESEIENVKPGLSHKFKLKDLGKPK